MSLVLLKMVHKKPMGHFRPKRFVSMAFFSVLFCSSNRIADFFYLQYFQPELIDFLFGMQVDMQERNILILPLLFDMVRYVLTKFAQNHKIQIISQFDFPSYQQWFFDEVSTETTLKMLSFFSFQGF